MARRTPKPTLATEQKAESDRIFVRLQQAAFDSLRALADLLATKDDSNTFGATEYTARDIALRIASKALESALEGRKRRVPRLLQRLPPVPRVGQVRSLAN